MFTGVFRDRSHARLGPARTPEQVLKRLLVGRSVRPNRFLRRAAIGPFLVDYVCPEKALVIELINEHRAFQTQDATDRTVMLERFGYRVLRFWCKEVTDNPDLVLRQILQALA
jgi:very-short-patch-repair endonuclease